MKLYVYYIMSINKVCILLVLALLFCPKLDAFQPVLSSRVRGVDQKAKGPMRRVSALDMATWSNGQAIKEYQG